MWRTSLPSSRTMHTFVLLQRITNKSWGLRFVLSFWLKFASQVVICTGSLYFFFYSTKLASQQRILVRPGSETIQSRRLREGVTKLSRQNAIWNGLMSKWSGTQLPTATVNLCFHLVGAHWRIWFITDLQKWVHKQTLFAVNTFFLLHRMSLKLAIDSHLLRVAVIKSHWQNGSHPNWAAAHCLVEAETFS